MKFDDVDGGVAAVFEDGPKKGHVGVVNRDGTGTPVEHLTFMDGALVYTRTRPRHVKGEDLIRGGRRRYLGVGYRMDPRCPLALQVQQGEDEVHAQAGVVES